MLESQFELEKKSLTELFHFLLVLLINLSTCCQITLAHCQQAKDGLGNSRNQAAFILNLSVGVWCVCVHVLYIFHHNRQGEEPKDAPRELSCPEVSTVAKGVRYLPKAKSFNNSRIYLRLACELSGATSVFGNQSLTPNNLLIIL